MPRRPFATPVIRELIAGPDDPDLSVAGGVTAGDPIGPGPGITTMPALDDVLVAGNDAGESQIKNLADPTDPQDAATKNYVDTMGPGSTPDLAAVLAVGNDTGGELIVNLPAVNVDAEVGRAATASGTGNAYGLTATTATNGEADASLLAAATSAQVIVDAYATTGYTDATALSRIYSGDGDADSGASSFVAGDGNASNKNDAEVQTPVAGTAESRIKATAGAASASVRVVADVAGARLLILDGTSDGAPGDVLTSDGTNAEWQAPTGGGGSGSFTSIAKWGVD